MKNVFQTMIDYLGESLVSQGIIEQERADICGFEILEKIFETEPDSEVRRKTDRENLLNWVRKGSVPDKNWKEFVMGKRKVLSDDNFLNIAQRVIQLDPDEIEGKKSVDENKTEIVDEKILEARKAEKAEALLDNYNYELIYNDYQLKMDLTQKLENYIGYRGINPSASILSKIIFCIIHGLYGRAKKSVPYGIQTSFYLERKIDAKIEDDWNFVWVRGDAYSGKTRWLLKYAEKSDKEAVYINNPMSYQEIIEKITIEEDNVLDESTRKILGCHFRRSIEGKVERIQHLVKDFVLIIDGDSLKKTDQRKLFELSKSDRVQVFIETRLDVNDNDPKQPIVSIPAFTERETIDLFYLVSGKYVDIEKLDKDDELSAILPTLCKQVFNNPGLIILLAENYWSRIKKDNTESGKRNALKFLEDIINFQPIGTKDEIDWGEKCSSSIHYSNGKQSQNKLDGHIRHLFSSCVPEMDKDVFYVISLLDGIKLEVRHLKNWFGISEATIHKLEVEGWCNIDQSSLVVGIPQLIVHALKVDVHKNINTSRNFLRYIKNISATLNRMEVEPADVEIMQQVILQLHNILVNQLKIAETKVKKEWFEFHFTCVRYFLYNGAYDSDGNEIFTDCSSNFLNAYINVFTPYMDSDFHEMAIKAAFGDQESLNVFKKAEESGNTENQESQNNVNEDTVEAEENAEEDGIDNYVRYDFLYGDDGCELKAMLFYQQKNSGVIAFEYIDYEDESNSKNINGTFEEDENGNGSILMETGDQLDYVVDLYSYPTSLTITLQDGSDLIMMDYDWSLENAG